MTEGHYDLGFLVLDGKTGEVLGLSSETTRMVNGAVFFEDVVEIVDVEGAHEAAKADYEAAMATAQSGNCEEAWESWRQARYHVWRDIAWRAKHHDWVVEALAQCHVERAAGQSKEENQIASLLEAKAYDHNLSAYKEAARPLAKNLAQRGAQAFQEEDWESAYPLLRDALALDPRQSSVRRMAEEARDKRLGILSKERDSARKKRERDEARKERERDRSKVKRKKRKKRKKRANPKLSPDLPMAIDPSGEIQGDESLPNPLSLPQRLTNPPKIHPRPEGSTDPISPLENPRPVPTESPPSP
jgi:tetratricopeptide (TPR) repeat protein